MRITKKILLTLVLTLTVAAVMSVCAFAFDINTDLPSGVTNEDARWVDSGFTDVDTEDGWYLMSGSNDFSATDTSFPTFANLAGGRFYWNKTTNEAVWVVTSTNMFGNSGEDGVVSLKNPTSSTQQKFYAFASCFVDVTNTANNVFKTHFASNSTDRAQYVTQNATKYPIYESYIAAKIASKQWANVNVTKAAYTDFIALKAELGYAEDGNVTDTAHQDQLVAWAYTNIAPYKNLVNCKENGAKFNMAWIFNQLAANNLPFASLEFRAAKGVTPYYGTVGLVTTKLEAEKILFDSKIEKISFTNIVRGLFIGNAALKTLAHVTYNEDGTYAETVAEGVVDLTGFTQVVDYVVSGKTYHLSEMLMNAGMTKMVWFATLMDEDIEYAGIIDNKSVSGAKNLEEIIFPANVTLKEIKSSAFSGCSALRTLDVQGTVADDLKIEASAFSGVSGLTIKVYSDIDKANMEKALAEAGVTATVVTTKVDEPDDDEPVSIPSVITADGFMIRTESYNGLRALFSFDEDEAVSVARETGYTLIEYGAVAASAANYEKAGSGKTLLAQADGRKVQRIVIFADDGTGLNKYVDVDAKQYCIAVRDFEGEVALRDVYVAGYAIWSNGTDTVITISEYESAKIKKTISLYTLTLEAFKAGLVNSQMTDSVCLWDVLKYGALSVTEAETKAPSELLTLTQGYEYDADGKFTYVDLPLRAWKMYTNAAGKVLWNSRGVTVEETATTGILWSVLVDGDNLVVVYRADPEFDGTAALPKLSDSYGASAPYSDKYFRVTAANQVTEDLTANGLLKTATIYSPIFTTENSAKINTIVVDYGVDKFGQQSISTASVTTMVYPEGMTSETYLLAGCTNLKNFIYATENKSYLDAYDVDSLVDLTGLAKVSDYGLAYGAVAIENILLPEKDKFANGQQYAFSNARDLSRVWTVGSDMPAAGVMDLTQTKISMICKSYFQNLDSIKDVYMPESFKGINSYSMAVKNQRTDTGRWLIFGDNSSATKLNIHVENWEALNCIANTFYEAHQDPDHNDGKEATKHIVDFLQITYKGETKTVLEWRADFPAQYESPRNYGDFVAIDWADVALSVENNRAVVVDRALTDASGNYNTVKISKVNTDTGLAFDGIEFEAFCDTIDALYPDPDISQYNMYFDEEQRAAIMATTEYAKQLRLNVMENVGCSAGDSVRLYAVTIRNSDGTLELTDVDYDSQALSSYALTASNTLSTKAGTISFVNGMATGATNGQFCTVSKNTAVVSAAKNMVFGDSTVFTFVAGDGIFTYTGKPENTYSIVLTSDTFIVAANAAQVMVVDRTRSINEIAVGDDVCTGRILEADCTWVSREIADTWAFANGTAEYNYSFVAIDWSDAAFAVENGRVLEVDRALTDTSGQYKTVRISAIRTESTFSFASLEFEAFCDTIDVLYENPDITHYNKFLVEAEREAVMADPEYAKQLRTNAIEVLCPNKYEMVKLYAVTGQDTNGNLILADVDYNKTALASPAWALEGILSTNEGTIEFADGMATGATNGQFCTFSQDQAVVSTAENMVFGDSTVFTFVAKDNIFIYTGKPEDTYRIALTADTFIISANTAHVMVVDRTRLAKEIAVGWPVAPQEPNYSFVTFDVNDTTFALDNNVLVVEHALTDASGEYTSVRISAINNGVGGIKCHTFGGMEFQVFVDTIDALYATPDLNQYNMYFNEAQRKAVMSTDVYAEQLYLNVMEELGDNPHDTAPKIYAVTAQDDEGNLILTDVDYDPEALSSYASDESNKLTTKAGVITFKDGVANGQFCTTSKNTDVVSTAENMTMTDETVFTVVAADGIFTYTGKPANNYSLVLTADTFLVAANTAQVMIIDRTRSVNQILLGDVEYFGKFLDEHNSWINRTICDTWAFNENTNNCPQGFKWLVDAAYLVTSETKLEAVVLGEGVVYHTYTDLYDLVACKNVEKTFLNPISLTPGNIVVEDRVYGFYEGAAIEDVFHVYGANNVNWTWDTYVGKLVSGSTVAYYEFGNFGKFEGVTPDLIIITTGSETTVSTDIADLKAGATIYFTLFNGVPTGYAIQS